MASRLTALALNCTLSPSPAESSTQLMIDQVAGGSPRARRHGLARTTPTPVANAAHLARHLVAEPYPGVKA